jgi:hypothetical protein
MEGIGSCRHRLRIARNKLVWRTGSVSNCNCLFKVKGNCFDDIIFVCCCIGSHSLICYPYLSDKLRDNSGIAVEYKFVNFVFVQLIEFQCKRLDFIRILRSSLTLLLH